MRTQPSRAATVGLLAAGLALVSAGSAAAQGLTPRWAVNGQLRQARFVNAGQRPLWRTVTVFGTPIVAPGSEQHGVSVEKTWFTFAGAPANLATVKQGDRVIVRIAGGSQQGRTVALAVDDALPAGFEIESVLGPDDAEKGPFKFLGSLTTPKAQESRDDRYVAALDLERHSTAHVFYLVRAVTPGSYAVPPPMVQDMYRPQIRGIGKSTPAVLKVEQPK